MTPSVAWIALVATCAQLPGPVHQYEAQNPACGVPSTAAPLCDKAFDLFETGVRVERERDVCRVDLSRSEAKLKNHLVPPPPVVVTESEIPTWFVVVGTVLVAVAFIGGAYAGVQVSK